MHIQPIHVYCIQPSEWKDLVRQRNLNRRNQTLTTCNNWHYMWNYWSEKKYKVYKSEYQYQWRIKRVWKWFALWPMYKQILQPTRFKSTYVYILFFSLPQREDIYLPKKYQCQVCQEEFQTNCQFKWRTNHDFGYNSSIQYICEEWIIFGIYEDACKQHIRCEHDIMKCVCCNLKCK